jgi:hypothetical protein
MAGFEANQWADNYGTRMRGYITAPATGNYTFWLRAMTIANCGFPSTINLRTGEIS